MVAVSDESRERFEKWLGEETCEVHNDESANKNAWYGWQAAERSESVLCGGSVNSVGGCGGEIPLRDAYRCADCELYFHRDCLRKHCETSSYVTAIRANKELIDGWKKEVEQYKARAESAERDTRERDAQLVDTWLDQHESLGIHELAERIRGKGAE